MAEAGQRPRAGSAAGNRDRVPNQPGARILSPSLPPNRQNGIRRDANAIQERHDGEHHSRSGSRGDRQEERHRRGDERDPHRDRSPDRPRDRSRDRDHRRDCSRSPDRPRDHPRSPDRPRDRPRSSDRPRDWDGPRDRLRDRDRPRDRPRSLDRPRGHPRSPDRPRERPRSRDRPRDRLRDWDGPRDGPRDRPRSLDRRRDRSRSPGRPRNRDRPPDRPPDHPPDHPRDQEQRREQEQARGRRGDGRQNENPPERQNFELKGQGRDNQQQRRRGSPKQEENGGDGSSQRRRDDAQDARRGDHGGRNDGGHHHRQRNDEDNQNGRNRSNARNDDRRDEGRIQDNGRNRQKQNQHQQDHEANGRENPRENHRGLHRDHSPRPNARENRPNGNERIDRRREPHHSESRENRERSEQNGEIVPDHQGNRELAVAGNLQDENPIRQINDLVRQQHHAERPHRNAGQRRDRPRENRPNGNERIDRRREPEPLQEANRKRAKPNQESSSSGQNDQERAVAENIQDEDPIRQINDIVAQRPHAKRPHQEAEEHREYPPEKRAKSKGNRQDRRRKPEPCQENDLEDAERNQEPAPQKKTFIDYFYESLAKMKAEEIELAADRNHHEGQHEQNVDYNILHQAEQFNYVVNLNEIELPPGTPPQRNVYSGQLPIASPEPEDLEVEDNDFLRGDEPFENEQESAGIVLIEEQEKSSDIVHAVSPGPQEDLKLVSNSSMKEEDLFQNEHTHPHMAPVVDDIPDASSKAEKDDVDSPQGFGDPHEEVQENVTAPDSPRSNSPDQESERTVRDGETPNELPANDVQSAKPCVTLNEEVYANSSCTTAPEMIGDGSVHHEEVITTEIESSFCGYLGAKSPVAVADNFGSEIDVSDVAEDVHQQQESIETQSLFTAHEELCESQATDDVGHSDSLTLIEDDTNNSTEERIGEPEDLLSVGNAILGSHIGEVPNQLDMAQTEPELTKSLPEYFEESLMNDVVARQDAEEPRTSTPNDESTSLLDDRLSHNDSNSNEHCDDSEGQLLSDSMLNETTEELDSSSTTEEPLASDGICENSASETQTFDDCVLNEPVERKSSQSGHEIIQNNQDQGTTEHDETASVPDDKKNESVCRATAEDSLAPSCVRTPGELPDHIDMSSSNQDVIAHNHSGHVPESELLPVAPSSRKRPMESSEHQSSGAKKQKQHAIDSEMTTIHESDASALPKSHILDAEDVDSINESQDVNGDDSFVGNVEADELMPTALGTAANDDAPEVSETEAPEVSETRGETNVATVNPDQEEQESSAATPSPRPKRNNNLSPDVQQPDNTAKLQEISVKDDGQLNAQQEPIAETPIEIPQASETCEDFVAPSPSEEKGTCRSLDGAPANEHVEAQPSAPIVQVRTEPAPQPIYEVNENLTPSAANKITKEPVSIPFKTSAVIPSLDLYYSGMWASDSSTVFLNQVNSERASQVDIDRSKYCFNYDVMPPSTDSGCGENIRPIVSAGLFTGTQRTAYTTPKNLIVQSTDPK